MAETKESHQFDRLDKEIDLVNRDPKHLSDGIVKVEFEEAVAEPDGVYSFPAVWSISHKAFAVSGYWSYRLLTALFGVPMAVLWGFLYACISFGQVWAAVPCVRCFLLELECLAITFPVCIRGICDPFFHAAGGLLLSIRLALRKEP
ncbi:caveolin-1-like [Stegostoma tigrinum]|uniref:caveolin-1-like n=1 Tax=Stegostoma tigrinum TaxID=3053191 RepID=UPI00287080D4|nr:caveolin-1-like [Stegostoma tigrinum]